MMLELSTIEKKIFRILSQTPRTVADISRKVKMPRMTTYTVLLRLQKSKLATTRLSPTGKKELWINVCDEVILTTLNTMKKKYLSSVPKSEGKEEMKVYKGSVQVGEMLMHLTARKDGARMYSIQSSQNFPKWIEVMGKEWVNKHNRAVVKHKLITLTLHSKDVPKAITQEQDIMDAYKGRLGNSHSIDEGFLVKGLALYIFDETILLVNLNTVEAFLITRKDLSLFLSTMFSFMFSHSDPELFFKQFGR